jgi:hypothetical protein
VRLSFPKPIDEGHDVSSFACGKLPLDNWLKTRALANHQKGFSAVIVAHENRRVVGYYGLAVERQPPCPRATTILAGFQAAEVGVSFNVSG